MYMERHRSIHVGTGGGAGGPFAPQYFRRGGAGPPNNYPATCTYLSQAYPIQ